MRQEVCASTTCHPLCPRSAELKVVSEIYGFGLCHTSNDSRAIVIVVILRIYHIQFFFAFAVKLYFSADANEFFRKLWKKEKYIKPYKICK